MSGVKRVVAAVDLSEISGTVLASARERASRLGCGLTLIHVMEEFGEEDERLLLPVLKSWVEHARGETRASFDALIVTPGIAETDLDGATNDTRADQ